GAARAEWASAATCVHRLAWLRLPLRHRGGLSGASTQQPPPFEHGECAIEAVADLSMAAGRANVFDRLQLVRGGLAVLSLELDRVHAASVKGDHVRHTSAHTKPFQARCVRWAPINRGIKYRDLFKHSALGSLVGHQLHLDAVPDPPKAPGSAGVAKPHGH